MRLFSKTRGFFDDLIGKKRHAQLSHAARPFDAMQKYLTVGEYPVGANEHTPGGKSYTLTVYQEKDGSLYQALSPAETDSLAPTYTRKFDKRLGRFRAFQNVKTGERYTVHEYLDGFASRIRRRIRTGRDSVNIGILTDTHYKDADAVDFYGYNGLIHVKEFNYLEKTGLLDFKAHLGDWMDGSDAGLVGERELIKLRDAWNDGGVPFAIIKGNHDENDKFDEHHDLKPSFPENEFENIMWPCFYNQPEIHYISRQHGTGYFDKDNVRFVFVNTSDIPYELDEHGKKKYDNKLVLGLREDQFEEIIEILEHSSGKRLIFMSHGNPINRRGNNALKYNGRSLHELLVAFNQREKGYLSASNGPAEFALHNAFDFTQIRDAKVIAYFCGHRHIEDQYRINGIQYVLFNCSALMGPNHALTTAYNKRWNRQIDHVNEFAGYVVNIDLHLHVLQVFGYGAASRLRIFPI
jgi:hypothetical protein